MVVLVAHLTMALDPFRPVDQKRIADAAVIAIALPHLERRVEGHRPAGGVMVVRQRATQHIQVVEVLLQAIGNAVEKLIFVDRAGRSTLTTGAVIGDHYYKGVVELSRLFQEVDDPADLVIGVAEEARVHLGHAPVQLLFVLRQRVPGLDVIQGWERLPIRALRLGRRANRVDRRQRGILWHKAHLLLALEHQLAVALIAHVKLALVLVSPLPGRVMRRVAGARAEVHEKRSLGSNGFGVADELQGLVRQVSR